VGIGVDNNANVLLRKTLVVRQSILAVCIKAIVSEMDMIAVILSVNFAIHAYSSTQKMRKADPVMIILWL
jgi:hypothetical protein